MPSKSFKIVDSLSTEEIRKANPYFIAKAVADSNINKRAIFDFIFELLEELETIDDPEERAIKNEKIRLIRELLQSVLSLTEDKSQNDKFEMPEEPNLQIITEQPTPAVEEMPPSFARIIPRSKKKGKRYIN